MYSYRVALFLMLFFAFLLLPVLGSAAVPPSQSTRGQGIPADGSTPRIDVRDDRLTVELHRVSWGIVLQELQRHTGLTFRVVGALDGTITEAFEALPLEKALRRLFRNANLVFLYTGGKEGERSGSRLAQVWIQPREGSVRPTAQAPQAVAQRLEDRAPAARADDAVAALIENAMAAETGADREKAVAALAGYKDPRIKETLLQALRDPDASVRESVVDALAELKDDAAVDHLGRTLIEDTSADVRASAAEALEEIASPRAIDALRRALEDQSADVRETAVEALGSIGGNRAVEALRQALRDENENVREAAQEALSQLTGKGVRN
ncbi:MAG: HEAT repeat domain-containing protein [Candidatus Entotheonellia bacterium]